MATGMRCPQCGKNTLICRYVMDIGGLEDYTDVYEARCLSCDYIARQEQDGGRYYGRNFPTNCPFCGVQYCNNNSLKDPAEIKKFYAAIVAHIKPIITLKLGTGLKTGQDFLNALCKKGTSLEEEACSALLGPDFKPVAKPMEVDVVKVTLTELGFNPEYNAQANKNDTPYGDLLARAIEFGFAVCPDELAAQLCLQDEQLARDGYHIGSKPIRNTKGELVVFSVLKYSSEIKTELIANKACHFELRGDLDFIFIRPRVRMKCPKCEKDTFACWYVGDVGGNERYTYVFEALCTSCGFADKKIVDGGWVLCGEERPGNCPFCGVKPDCHAGKNPDTK